MVCLVTILLVSHVLCIILTSYPIQEDQKNVSIKPGNNIAGSILVLDDDFDINMLIKISLQKIGYDVFGFTNPLLALEHFRINHQTYSLAIVDIRMPAMDGFEFAKNISRIKPEIKVILTTAFDVNDDLLLMNTKYNNNVIGIIQKPISPKKLAKIVYETGTKPSLGI